MALQRAPGIAYPSVEMFSRLAAAWRLWRIYDEASEQAIKENPMAAKNLFMSKTFWFNAAALLIGFAQEQGLFSLIPEPYGPAVLALGNIVLRIVTTQPVALPGAKS